MRKDVPVATCDDVSEVAVWTNQIVSAQTINEDAFHLAAVSSIETDSKIFDDTAV